MADQFSKMYDVERVGGDQRTRLAEMLRAAGQNQPQGQMVSGWYVKPSWSQNLNTALSGALGTYMGAQLDEERKTKTAELLRDLSQGKAVEPMPVTQNFNGLDQRAEGQTPFPVQAPQNELERLTQRPQSAEQSQISPAMAPKQEQRYVPLTDEEKIGKVMELAQYNPYAAQIWSAQDTARQNRLMKLEDEASRRAWQAEQNQMNRQSREDMIRLSAGFAAANRSEKPLTEFQGKSVSYGTRAATSHNILNAYEDEGSGWKTNTAQWLSGVPVVGSAANYALNANEQRVAQAQRDFINATLRQESGAVIGDKEFENARRQYFPQPGDSAEVIAQKRANRELVVKGFARQAGPGGRDIAEAFNSPVQRLEPKAKEPSAQVPSVNTTRTGVTTSNW